MPAAFDEQLQYTEGLWRQRNRVAVAQQNAFCGIEAEGTKFVDLPGLRSHECLNNSLTDSLPLLNDFLADSRISSATKWGR